MWEIEVLIVDAEALARGDSLDLRGVEVDLCQRFLNEQIQHFDPVTAHDPLDTVLIARESGERLAQVGCEVFCQS